MAAVKLLSVLHHRADYIFISFGDNWAHSGYFENQRTLKPMLGAYTALQATLVYMKRFNETESSISVLLCVLCSPKKLGHSVKHIF